MKDNKILVHCILSDGRRYHGYIHMASEDRVQDILNDNRTFIPIEISFHDHDDHVNGIIMINKAYIISIEERDI